MASYQYVYHMENVSKTYPGGKTCFENIHLNFLPGVKIGVVGVNGAGKSTLLKIMAGMDKDFKGEAWAAKGDLDRASFIVQVKGGKQEVVDMVPPLTAAAAPAAAPWPATHARPPPGPGWSGRRRPAAAHRAP